MKRLLQYTSQKITTHFQRSLARHLGSCSYVKRLLQYSQSKKNNHAIFRSSPHTLALTYPHSSSLLPHLLLLSTYFLRASCSLLVPRFSFLGMSASLMPMHLWLACIHYMHALHLVPTTYMLPSAFYAHLISCFVALCTYFIPYFTSLLCTCTAYF